MRIRELVLVVILPFVSGCARTYEKPGMTQAELDRDWKDCADLQMKIENSMGGRVHNNGDPEEYSKPCMEKRGYRQVLR